MKIDNVFVLISAASIIISLIYYIGKIVNDVNIWRKDKGMFINNESEATNSIRFKLDEKERISENMSEDNKNLNQNTSEIQEKKVVESLKLEKIEIGISNCKNQDQNIPEFTIENVTKCIKSDTAENGNLKCESKNKLVYDSHEEIKDDIKNLDKIKDFSEKHEEEVNLRENVSNRTSSVMLEDKKNKEEVQKENDKILDICMKKEKISQELSNDGMNKLFRSNELKNIKETGKFNESETKNDKNLMNNSFEVFNIKNTANSSNDIICDNIYKKNWNINYSRSVIIDDFLSRSYKNPIFHISGYNRRYYSIYNLNIQLILCLKFLFTSEIVKENFKKIKFEDPVVLNAFENIKNNRDNEKDIEIVLNYFLRDLNDSISRILSNGCLNFISLKLFKNENLFTNGYIFTYCDSCDDQVILLKKNLIILEYKEDIQSLEEIFGDVEVINEDYLKNKKRCHHITNTSEKIYYKFGNVLILMLILDRKIDIENEKFLKPYLNYKNYKLKGILKRSWDEYCIVYNYRDKKLNCIFNNCDYYDNKVYEMCLIYDID